MDQGLNREALGGDDSNCQVECDLEGTSHQVGVGLSSSGSGKTFYSSEILSIPHEAYILEFGNVIKDMSRWGHSGISWLTRQFDFVLR